MTTLQNRLTKNYYIVKWFYQFSIEQIERIEKASNELYRMCLKAAQHVISKKLYSRFCIPEEFIPLIRSSWDHSTPSIYGRFDLSWNGDLSTVPKMLEFNADT